MRRPNGEAAKGMDLPGSGNFKVWSLKFGENRSFQAVGKGG